MLELRDTNSTFFRFETCTCSVLEKLALQRNEIGDVGAKAIIKALESNTTLLELKIEGNDMGEEQEWLITDMMEGRGKKRDALPADAGDGTV